MGITITSWVGRIIVGGMFLMTGIMKITMQAEPKALFEQLGGTPMMLFTGVIELVAAVLILIPKTRVYGAVLAMGVMGGAIGSHLAVLEDDSMLPIALGLFVIASVVVFLHRAELPVVGTKFVGDASVSSENV